MEKHRQIWIAWYIVMFSAVVAWMAFRPHIPAPQSVAVYSNGITPTRVAARAESGADIQLRRITQHMLMR